MVQQLSIVSSIYFKQEKIPRWRKYFENFHVLGKKLEKHAYRVLKTRQIMKNNVDLKKSRENLGEPW
jgi:hypothetical protein